MELHMWGSTCYGGLQGETKLTVPWVFYVSLILGIQFRIFDIFCQVSAVDLL